MSNRDEKLYQILSDVLDCPVDQITEEASTDSVETWTSLMHLNLIMAIENGFGITISPEDSMDLLSVKIIRMYLEERGIN